VKAVVLAAGEGTRLRPLTDEKPKPLVEVAGKPMLERCFDLLASLGVEEFVVVVGYMADAIEEKYGDEYCGAPITYAHQSERKGLAHALMQAEPHVDDSFLLMHGDNIFDPSARADILSVVRSGADATLLVEAVSAEKARNSAVVVIERDLVVDVVERDDCPPSRFAVVGFYSLPPSVFDACRRTEPSQRGEHELGDALALLAEDADVRAVLLDGDRVNVNTPEDLERAEDLV
jgi:glucose-1-phosphate thymidylyltransferase